MAHPKAGLGQGQIFAAPDIASRRRLLLADQLQSSGRDTSPAYPLQALARVAQAFAGSQLEKREESALKDRETARSREMARILMGDEGGFGLFDPGVQGPARGGFSEAKSRGIDDLAAALRDNEFLQPYASEAVARKKFPELFAEPAEPVKPPQTREIKRGGEIVTQQFNPSTGAFEDIAAAPRFEPDVLSPEAEAQKARLAQASMSPRDRVFSQMTPEQQREALLKPAATVNLPDATNTKIADEAYQKADTQRAMAADAEIMIGMLDQGLDTDALKPIGTSIASVFSALGLDVDPNLPSAQAFTALSNRAALRLRNPESGLGLTGNTSDRDLTFLKNSVAGLGSTREANYILLLTERARARREAELSELKADYILENGSLQGYQKKRREFIDTTPLFTPEEQQRISSLAQMGSAGLQAQGRTQDRTGEQLPATPEELRKLSDEEILRRLEIGQ